jgi:thiamine-phosphate pyrophosphorylase
VELPRLYAVTDETVTPDDELPAAVGAVLAVGARMVQVRIKADAAERWRRLGPELRSMTRDHGALLVVNDHPEVALRIGADGVHLGRDDPPVERARALLGPQAVIGVTTYDVLERAARWRPGEVTYLGSSSPYASPLKKDKARPSMESFARLVASARVPVYAIGGVTPANAAPLIAAGCHGVAAVSSIFAAPDPGAAVRRFEAVLSRAGATEDGSPPPGCVDGGSR